MPTILVLHGPNMALRALAALDDALEARAEALTLELLTAQSNGEAGLIDALLAEAAQVDGVLVNPGVLAPSAWALAEALTLLEKPAVEVLLSAPPAARGPSALAGVVRAQVHGRGPEGYVAGLEQLAGLLGAKADGEADEDEDEDDEEAPRARRAGPPARRVGRRPLAPAARSEAPPEPEGRARPAKTLGRAAASTTQAVQPPGKSVGRRTPQASQPAVLGLSRAQVRQRLSARLAGTLSAGELSIWARTEWSALQKGGPCEPGWRERLDSVLLTLMASGRASDDALLAQLARLDG